MDKSFVILGEASESDEEENVMFKTESKEKFTSALDKGRSINKGTIVAGEASESESENEEDAFRQAFFAKNGAIQNNIDEDVHESLQYDTLLHKKLRECNMALYNNVCSESHQSLTHGVRAINSINQQLLVTQVQVQDAATSLNKAFENIKVLNEGLNSLLATPYIPDINIL